MRPEAGAQYDLAARAWLIFVILVTIVAVSMPTPVNYLYIPDVLLMVIYVAAAFRSDIFPVWLCFLAGLLADLLGGSPPGLQAALFIAVHAFAVSQRKHLNAVLFLWGGFALAALAGAVSAGPFCRYLPAHGFHRSRFSSMLLSRWLFSRWFPARSKA